MQSPQLDRYAQDAHARKSGAEINRAASVNLSNNQLQYLVKPNAADQIYKTRVVADRIKEGMYLKELQNG